MHFLPAARAKSRANLRARLVPAVKLSSFGHSTREGFIILDVTHTPAAAQNHVPQRARGTVRIAAKRRDDATALADLHMSGSLKALFPRQHGADMQAVLLNTAGGITGGDCFDTVIEARHGARLALTTQAAERIYRAQPGAPGRVDTHIVAEPGARVTWLPQETILFNGAALDRRLRIDAAPDARVIACETLVFGRMAMGEDVNTLFLRDRMDLRIDGQLMFADRLRLDGDARAGLNRMAIANGARAMASVIFAAPDAAARLDRIRDLLPDTGGAGALTPDLVFVRLLAEDAYALRKPLVPLLVEMTATDIPRTWTI